MDALGKAEESVLAALRGTGMNFEVITIDPDLADTAVFCEKYGYPLENAANTIIIASRREPVRFCACVVPATMRLDVNRRVRKLMGVPRASFASAKQMMSLTGMQVGGVTPFALPEGLPLYAEQTLANLPWVILGGGGRSTKIKVSPEVLARLGAELVSELGVLHNRAS